MDEFTGGRELTYNSAGMYERRQRTLREVRLMIAESGLEEFSLRELCRRAGIAQRTFYNAFGSKENAIALAIRQYLAEFERSAGLSDRTMSVEERIERTVRIQSRNLQIRSYTTAIMSVYYSPTAGREIRAAIRDVADQTNRPFLEGLQTSGQLRTDVTVEDVTRMLTTTGYAVLMEWCFGDLPDAEMVSGAAEVFLVVMATATRGAAYESANDWLDEVRRRGPRWLSLLDQAAQRRPAKPATTRAKSGRSA